MSGECKNSWEFTPTLLPKSKILEGTVIDETSSKYLLSYALNVAFAVFWSSFCWHIKQKRLVTNEPTKQLFYVGVHIPARKHPVTTELVSVNVKQAASNLLPSSLCCLCSSSDFLTVIIEFYITALRDRESERES